MDITLEDLKKLIAELTIENWMLKKKLQELLVQNQGEEE